MRRVIVLVCALAIFINLSTPIPAEPTIFGPTGLLVNPTADVTPPDHAWIALNFLDSNNNSIWTANVTGSISEEFEIGIGAVHPDNGDEGITFFLKWLFIPETENTPGGATGVTISDVAGINTTMWYAVASKFFYLGENASENASMHGGISYITGDGDDQFQFFMGLDVEIMENFIAIAEYNSDDSSFYDGFTYGARYYFGPQFTGQGGFVDGDFHVGVSFVF